MSCSDKLLISATVRIGLEALFVVPQASRIAAVTKSRPLVVQRLKGLRADAVRSLLVHDLPPEMITVAPRHRTSDQKIDLADNLQLSLDVEL